MSNYLGFSPTNSSEYYFISYNSEDADRVGVITTALADAGIPLWYDYGLEYGEKWEPTIAKKIRKCKSVILFFTKGILSKESSFVQKEYKMATKGYRKKIYVVLMDDIRIEDVPDDKMIWWMDILELQCINAFSISDTSDLVGKIVNAIGYVLSSKDYAKISDDAKRQINRPAENDLIIGKPMTEIIPAKTKTVEYTTEQLLVYVCANDQRIETLGLSNRPVNALQRIGKTKLSDIILMTQDELQNTRNMGAKSVNEILEFIENYKIKHAQHIIDYTNGSVIPEIICDTDPLEDPKNAEMILQFSRANDLPIDSLGLSVRSVNALTQQNIIYISELVIDTEAKVQGIRNLGRKSIEEIRTVVRNYLEKNRDRIIAYCNHDENALYDDAFIKNKILAVYQEKGFEGLSFDEIKQGINLPVEIADQRLKQLIGKLIAEKQLEYVDYRCYRVYQKFEDYLAHDTHLKERTLNFIKQKLDGKTLEEIGNSFNLTKERTRQVISDGIDKLKVHYQIETGCSYFDEDYYQYLYQNYYVNKESCQWLGISFRTLQYLSMTNKKMGERPLNEAETDSKIDAGLRLKIRNFNNRDKIYVDGVWINKNRADLERIVLRKNCRDAMSMAEFAAVYNTFLQKHGIEKDSGLYLIDEGTIRTRINRFADSRIVLYSFHQTIRYYDIDSRDYTELLDELDLNNYENISISTNKFMKEHPEIMKKYDIRDQYELHNLLKKIIPEGSYNDFHARRMPMIEFGVFDRDSAILNILIENSPITTKDLVNILYEKYGLDRSVSQTTYLIPFSAYYHNGIYSIDRKVLESRQKEILMKTLTEDIYYVDEIRKQYLELFPEEDGEKINPYTLKEMGFSVYSDYVLRNYDSASEYFNYLLTRNDLTDISEYRKRFTYISAFTDTLYELKRQQEVIEYRPNQLIHIRRLEQTGIDRDALRNYCEEVCSFVENHAFFSIQSLRNNGFISKLNNQGFEDWFYANVLAYDDRFSYGNIYSTIIMYKGKTEVTIRSFLESIIRNHGSIDYYDLIDILTNTYGCKAKDCTTIRYHLTESDVYYDENRRRFYANAEVFEKELDASEGL